LVDIPYEGPGRCGGGHEDGCRDVQGGTMEAWCLSRSKKDG